MKTEFDFLVEQLESLESLDKDASAELRAYPRGEMGLTLDSAKDARWRQLRSQRESIRRKQAPLIRYLMKHHKAEMRDRAQAKRRR